MKTHRLLHAVLVAAGLHMVAPLFAQPAAPTEPAPNPSAPPVQPAAPKPDLVITPDALAPTVAKGKDTLSVDFEDQDNRTVLRNVADLFELNVVIPDTLTGKSSIKLRDVTWRQIFQVVLSPVGYTFIEEGNIIKVVNQDALAQEPLTTEVFTLNYAKADAATITAITSLLSKDGKIIPDNRTNSLIITDRGSQMLKLRPIIERLDKATDQVMIESKFIEVTDRDVKNLGVNWASLSAYQVSATPASTAAFDARPTDVFGADITGFSGQGTTIAAVFSAAQFNLVLSALQTLSNTKIVSNPTIVTLNNTEARIDVGEENPIPNYAYNEQRGSFEVSGFTYKSIGVILKVTPQVNASGFIRLTLAPEVSQKNGTTSFGGAGGAEIPILATRKATTQVSLKDGYTMAIGGLMTASGTKGGTKVPVLGSIPVLGRLFRSNSSESQSSNLLIFITAKTLSAEGAPTEQVFDSRVVRQIGIQKDELPGYRDGSDPFAPAPVNPTPKK
jgi:type IV pilus assembly protein PilQ